MPTYKGLSFGAPIGDVRKVLGRLGRHVASAQDGHQGIIIDGRLRLRLLIHRKGCDRRPCHRSRKGVPAGLRRLHLGLRYSVGLRLRIVALLGVPCV